jgi:hypothetical protein
MRCFRVSALWVLSCFAAGCGSGSSNTTTPNAAEVDCGSYTFISDGSCLPLKIGAGDAPSDAASDVPNDATNDATNDGESEQGEGGSIDATSSDAAPDAAAMDGSGGPESGTD